MKGGNKMKKTTLFLVLLVIFSTLLIAGCTTQQPVATTTPTPVLTETTVITAAPTTAEITVAPTTTVITAAPTTAEITVAPTQAAGMNIVETLTADGRFTTLLTLLNASQLDGNLSGPGPFTVFAPTDDAFKKLPDGTVDSLLKNPQGYYLNKMLLYHVVKGKWMASDLMRTGSLNTLAGQSIMIDTSNGMIFLNGNAKVISSDIVCSNGVIHVIDTVLNPPQGS
jgi:uncharacterized surface protein with fasciclin (FAS1) repeats